MAREISEGRRLTYYLGLALIIFGFITFFSVFITFALHFGDFSFIGQFGSIATRAVGGMALMVIGGILWNIGRAGLAGAGVILDPKQARDDLEPWSRSTGGMIHDALEEINPGLVKPRTTGEPVSPDEVIKIRCQVCHGLNDENARFCNQCGSQI